MNDRITKLKTGVLIAGACVALGAPFYSYFPSDRVETTINDVTVKRYSDRDTYLVFTDAGVFQNKSAWYRGKWSSSDMQNECIKLKGKRVELQKYGWRAQPLHRYENIVGVREVR